MHLIVNCPRNSKMALNFNRPSVFLRYGSKQSDCCLDQKIKNRLAYLNVDAIFEFLGQFTIRCMFQKGIDNFEIEHKTC